MRHCENEKGDSGRMNRDMSQDRRNFIRGFGATLGSLIVSGSLPGCGPKKNTGPQTNSEDATEVDPPSNGRTLSAPEWGQLRQCWLSLKTLASDDVEIEVVDGQVVVEAEILKRHQAVIDRLVAAGQMDEFVARHMHVAFGEAIDHVLRARNICYYVGVPPEAVPRKDLLQQADTLSRMSVDLDPSTVAKAQAAIAQDIAFFETFNTYTPFTPVKTYKGRRPNSAQLKADFKAGKLEASPEALEAARLLTRLFAETAD
jgi:hypothetical protein